MSFWVIFLMARTVPPSFVENSPKLWVLIPMIRHKPKRAKNRGEPRKMTHCWETEFFSGWSEWESCSPRYTCVMSCQLINEDNPIVPIVCHPNFCLSYEEISNCLLGLDSKLVGFYQVNGFLFSPAMCASLLRFQYAMICANCLIGTQDEFWLI